MASIARTVPLTARAALSFVRDGLCDFANPKVSLPGARGLILPIDLRRNRRIERNWVPPLAVIRISPGPSRRSMEVHVMRRVFAVAALITVIGAGASAPASAASPPTVTKFPSGTIDLGNINDLLPADACPFPVDVTVHVLG